MNAAIVHETSPVQATWRVISSPAAAGSALAMIEINGDIEAALRALNMDAVPVGSYRLRSFASLDTGIVSRWSADLLILMPHGGPALLKRLTQWLTEAGLAAAPELPSWDVVRRAYPEASSSIEAAALWCMSGATSPGAIELLLAQAELWKGTSPEVPRTLLERERDRVLSRLLTPALVLIVGAPNVGKSRLLNAFTGRTSSIVSDQPGTTRDHVGVCVTCGDVTVRLVDTPGVRETDDRIEAEAQSLAAALWDQADLVLWCGDAEHGFAVLPEVSRSVPMIRLATRCDLGRIPGTIDLAVSSVTGEGMGDLSQLISERLVPRGVRGAPQPWRFWDGLIRD